MNESNDKVDGTKSQQKEAFSPVSDAAEAFHRPFSFLEQHLKGDLTAEFVETTLNISGGIRLCAELAHASNMDRTFNTDIDTHSSKVTPTLSIYDTDVMLRFAIASAALLETAAMKHIDWMSDAARRNAQKGGVQ